MPTTGALLTAAAVAASTAALAAEFDVARDRAAAAPWLLTEEFEGKNDSRIGSPSLPSFLAAVSLLT